MKDKFQIDFLGIGAPKAGTTWLGKCLEEHPQICFPSEKEINFFNKNDFYYIKKKFVNYNKGFNWYKKFFNNCSQGQISGEFSVTYLYDKEAPKLIYKHNPNVKIIIILRNPTDFFYSHYVHAKYVYDLPSINKLIDSEFIKYGFYSSYIRNYFKIFARDQILILLYDELAKNPKNLLKKVYNFLNVNDNFIPRSLNNIINPSAPKITPEISIYYSLRNRILRTNIGKRFNRFPGIKSFLVKIEIGICTLLGRAGERKKNYKEIPINIKERLDKVYYPEIIKLEKLIKCDLSEWTKDMKS